MLISVKAEKGLSVSMMENRKRIFEYDNYRTFLKDSYDYWKAVDKKFSFRYFSKEAGFKSPNVLKRVIDGQLNLSLESIAKFAKALKLNKEETVFFRNLVLLNQAKSHEEKLRWAREILRSRMFRKIHPLSEMQYNYYTQWYYIAVRECVGLPDFREDYKHIAQSILPEISEMEARKAVDDLLQIGLLDRDPVNGRLRQTNPIMSTPVEVFSPAVTMYHKEMIRKASDSIEQVPREQRDISAVAFPVSKETITKVKVLIEKFREQIVEVAAQDESPDRIYQLNLQLFPLVQKGQK